MLLVALFVACVNISAQYTDDIMQTDSIREVVVTGTRPVYNLSSPTPVQTLRGRDLERLNSQSVADAIRYFSGVQIKDYGGIGGLKTVNIRSMGTNHMGVFYDGIQLGNAQNGQVDLGKFSLDNMEAISLYNGQKSDIFQSAKDFGAAGTIYLTTIKPVFAEDKHTRLRMTYKTIFYEAIDQPLSYGLTNPSILWQQKLGKKTNSTLSAEWLHTNGRYRFENKEFNNDGSVAYDSVAIRENSDVNAFRIEGGLNGTIDSGEWNAKVYFYSSERGLPGATVRNSYWRNQRLWDRNFFMQGSFCKQFGQRYHLKANAKYAYDYTHYEDHDTGPWLDNTYIQQEAYVSIANKYDILPFWSVALSADLQYNNLDATYSLNQNDVDNPFVCPQRYTTLAALASALSLDWIKLQASILATAVHDEVRKQSAAPNQNEWTPAVFVSFKPFKKEDLHFRGFYKKIFRMPTFNDLYYALVADKNLKPEFATQYNLGITYGKGFKNPVFRNITLQVDAYHNEVTDKIVAIPTNNFFRWMMVNLGVVEIWGADVSAHTLFCLGNVYLKTNLAYTFQRAKDLTNPSEPYYGHQIPYTPKHSGSVTVNADCKSWGLNYSFIYVGERYDQQENIPKNYVQPWYTSDISLSKVFHCKPVNIKLSAEVNNLFNQYYAVVANYPMPGRNYKLIVSVDF